MPPMAAGLLALLLAVAAFAQTSASLSGIVHDANGGAVIGAKVTVSDPSKNFQLETKTSADGNFSFPTLQPGTYTVTVEAQGFKKSVKTGLVLAVADRQSTGVIALEVGDIANTVEVTADAAQQLIKTESGEQSQVISGEQVANLALNGRNYLDLVKLTPGVVSFVNAQTAGPGGLSSFNINGTRANQHNLTIDGTTNVDTGSNGTQHIALVLDNIAEFKILTSNYQAEYGRSAGGDIKVITKGGGRDFHGTGYYYHRHEQFNANSFFNNAQGRQRNFYRYNYQGFNLSGPVWLPKNVFGPLGSEKLREKVFWFVSREWQEQLLPGAARQSRVPTANEVNGIFTGLVNGNGQAVTLYDPLTGQPFPNNVIPTNRINPNGQAILPTPAIGGVGLMKDVTKHASVSFKAAGEAIIVIGDTRGHLGQSIYVREILGREEGAAPAIDLKVGFDCFTALANASAVDEDVDTPEDLQSLIHHRTDCSIIGDVGLNRDCRSARRANCSDRRLGFCLRSRVVHDDRIASSSQQFCCCGTDTGTASGNDRD